MIIYLDLINHEEMFSDIYQIREITTGCAQKWRSRRSAGQRVTSMTRSLVETPPLKAPKDSESPAGIGEGKAERRAGTRSGPPGQCPVKVANESERGSNSLKAHDPGGGSPGSNNFKQDPNSDCELKKWELQKVEQSLLFPGSPPLLLVLSLNALKLRQKQSSSRKFGGSECPAQNPDLEGTEKTDNDGLPSDDKLEELKTGESSDQNFNSKVVSRGQEFFNSNGNFLY
ncbi:PREDICTED: uncharacterized protein LOC102829756 [Chrysochloris asiatica]|uniref:Uncharacterized protein LOC102829756 n=1 Tax=Chrysochloris asiatica TaxID=185453 RepID=A0A9B0TWL7_CHRAS|nr:PREDICTED: uncharacterized protein LOC102829756 [Chrysochloris asiatica]